MSIDVPLFVSTPSFATYKTLGAELIPDAVALIVTPAPIVTAELVITTASSLPILISSFSPSITIDEVPIVNIPTILAVPFTTKS